MSAAAPSRPPAGRYVVLSWHAARPGEPWQVSRSYPGGAPGPFVLAAELRRDAHRREVRVVREEDADAAEASMRRRGGPA